MQHLPTLQNGSRSLVGTLLGDKWFVDGELGAGGMGTVYSAVHQHNARRVAIKVLNSTFARDPEVRERFYQEAYAANRVMHPGTVAALDDGVLSDGTPFLVMEILEGRDLEKCLNDSAGTLAEIDLLRIMTELLSILEAAHDAGILHRDIKPENIFCTTDGKVKLLDFGIAKITDSRRTHQTQCGSTIGTPAFMPPEQARGRWDELDARSDLWSVGATMFTLLSGRMVHERDTVNEQLLSAMTERPMSLYSVAPHVSADVIAIVDRALQFEQSKRYASAAEMREALVLALRARGELPHTTAPTLSSSGDTRDSRSHTTHRPVISSQTTIAVAPRARRVWWLAAAAMLLPATAVGVYVSATDFSFVPVTTHVQAASVDSHMENSRASDINGAIAEVPAPEPPDRNPATTINELATTSNDVESGAEAPAAPAGVPRVEKKIVRVAAVTPKLSSASETTSKTQPESAPQQAPDFDPLAQRR